MALENPNPPAQTSPLPERLPAAPAETQPSPELWAGQPIDSPGVTEPKPQKKRILGIDLARGFALIGMFTAHFGLDTSVEFADPSTWGGLVNGRSSILFAILAGVSLAIITGRTSVYSGQKLADARVKILVRALCIFVLGEILTSLNSYIAIILQSYAVLFVIALVCLRLRRRWLIAIALVWAIIGPLLAAVWEPLLEPFGLGVPMAELFIWGAYPVLTWIPYILIGLAIGRTDLTLRKNQVFLVVLGSIFAVMGYTAVGPYGELSSSHGITEEQFSQDQGSVPDKEIWKDFESMSEEELLALEDSDFGMPSAGETIAATLAAWDTAEPHSNTPFEIVGSGGFAVAFLGLCLLIAPFTRLLLAPAIAMGTMSLTVYTLHVVTFRMVQDHGVMDGGLAIWPWLITIIAAGAFALIWQNTLGRGPLERLLNRILLTVTGVRSRSKH
ncbi:heparan-alpha-glucosaminide N-acetyltransferase domain-containing protein [Jonesiaceae bacterium BS-20]|uniref:Heparan-alpha-glucosaminide N-acetyltransferase domain-containing protein n=1 Tax=Jonesiaceae bacterium BS-20 TaxID=3120821 RepID=A0AAU7DTF1_9MICO